MKVSCKVGDDKWKDKIVELGHVITTKAKVGN